MFLLQNDTLSNTEIHSNQTTNTYTPLPPTVYLQNLALLPMHFLPITCFFALSPVQLKLSELFCMLNAFLLSVKDVIVLLFKI